MPVRFVAEVSSNHHQNLDRCLAFIDRAAAIGCAAVKFQLFKVRELFAPEVLEQSEVHRAREQWELPISYIPKLVARCRQRDIQFSCTPFYLQAVQELEPFVDFYKIASYELLWDDLLIACAQTQKPVVLSTGMSTMDEVIHATRVMREAGCQDLTLLHCVSGYPAVPSECNLSSLETLREHCECAVGWSDHTVNPGVVYRAVHRWGAAMVEFHLDLDRQGEEYQAGHCWLPEEMAPVIQQVNCGLGADGHGVKAPTASEVDERKWRADPLDGLRPLQQVRETWIQPASVR
ncbi:N-acetylneuraminate synthase family protein [Candidatus Nitronereus thalassa]|uniref:N-acetylneuraminate synthase family protein n=1 Tax=Candidatus Nitronereus thalassa TaxID=3020898 RepID=A0ABU3K618_9BACT|nr:N-acetylneuraminate synthase family protein [Candidatus Nitronereus thalassa]MDT7041854.1 N-acetylneuraminate synthase family protein [Candidatus Nitronereus thalassa]